MYDGHMFLFGGYNGTERLNDMYEYSFESYRWRQVRRLISARSSKQPA